MRKTLVVPSKKFGPKPLTQDKKPYDPANDLDKRAASDSRIDILGTLVSQISHEGVVETVADWLTEPIGRYVCAANVHMVMEAYDSADFRAVINHADLATPDGMPLVWFMKLSGLREQTRVTGPELMLKILKAASARSWKIGLLGGTHEMLARLGSLISEQYADAPLVYSFSPPFRELSNGENEQICDAVNSAGVQILFVSLGCPKQEVWMAENKHRLNCVSFGVGAAFGFHSGGIKHAPVWIQRLGFEWLFRLASEPRRLWRRYAKHNPRFILYSLKSLCARKQ